MTKNLAKGNICFVYQSNFRWLEKSAQAAIEVFTSSFSNYFCQSKINFSTLARHSSLNEHTFRRQFRQPLDFTEINQSIIKQAECQITAFAMDASFIKKSGKETFGLDKFWNGCASRAEKGLEALIISLVCGKSGASFALTVDLTEPNLANKEADSERKRGLIFMLNRSKKSLQRFSNIRALACLMAIMASSNSSIE